MKQGLERMGEGDCYFRKGEQRALQDSDVSVHEFWMEMFKVN